ncbi:SIMPL domain-containing protein [Salinimonas marina]|uniref:SIMPL domain-containing protein n=1 Tax=Salinimonas marina TaxID=2785918 RepID=A0A7S9HEB7_9ALTE|nr:SIMPL domain-containing protein [Salinimonas marina]QPG07070.1 SIMPL domain-containing protein [Salinimonas marina]
MQHYLRITWFGWLVMLAPAMMVQAQEASPDVINVSGSGSVAVVPDRFTVTFVLEQKGQTVTKLKEQLQHDIHQLTNFLLNDNVQQKNIQTMQIRLHPRYENGPKGRVENGFVLSREVTIEHDVLDQYSHLIDGALKRGVTRISRFELIASNPQKAYEQALINAIDDAKSKAELLAGQLGAKIGKVTQISEGHSGRIVTEGRATMMMADGASGSLPGQQHIEATVNATFTLTQ